MANIRKYFPLFVLVLLPLLVLGTSCKKRRTKNAQTKLAVSKTLILATNSEPDTLNPLFAEMAASHEIMTLGHRELTMYDDTWTLIPDLATKVPTPENGQVKLIDAGISKGKKRQKMVVTWHIKKDSVWEDGTPVTADDFIFAWKVCLDPTQEIIDRDSCERVESMKAVGKDKKTLVVTWREPFAFYNTYRVHLCLPAHHLKTRYRAPNGKTRDLKKDVYGQRPLSNGPFRFKEWVPGQFITYVRNERYKPLANFQEISIRIIPNNMSMESNLTAGTIDAVTPSGGLTVPQIEGLKKRQGAKFKYYSVPGLVWAHVDFNLDDKWLSDWRVRKALAHSINRRQIIKAIFFDKYEIAHSFLPPRHWGYNAGNKEIEYDLKKAAQLLDEAGWKLRNKNKVRTNAKGEKLSLKFTAVAGIKDIEQLEQVYQSDLRSIGVNLQINNKPAKVFFGTYARKRKMPHMSFYSWVSDPASWPLTLWHKDYIPSEKNQWQGQNYPGWRSDEASELLDNIPTDLTLAGRRKKLKRVQELWAIDLPAIPMYFRPVVAVTRSDLQNYRPTGTQTPVTWNSWEWKFQ